MQLVELLSQSPDFVLYPDSSKHVKSMAQLISDLPYRKQDNVLVIQLLRDKEFLLMFTGDSLFNATFNKYNIAPEVEYYDPVIVCEEYFNSSYIVVGYWKGELD